MRRRQCLQGPELLQGYRECLQGTERLQGPGLLGNDQGQVRRRQGQVHALLVPAACRIGARYAGPPFRDNFRVGHSSSGADMNVASRLPNSSAAALADRQTSAVKPPFLGFGLGLRHQHYDEILASNPPIDWFEVISENYMLPGGQPLRVLDQIRERYPVVMHGVSLSIASTAPPNFEYLQGLKDLARHVEPKWVSDHLCWTGVHGKNLHDLLPIPYTEEALGHVISRVQLVQDFLGRAIVLENVSTYVQFNNSEMTEWEFLAELSRRSGCWLLFDVNNVYVSAFNHGYDPHTFLNGIPRDRVVQFHMAGHSHMGTHIIDTHDHPVCEDVWDLYVAALKRFGRVSTMIERDDNIPPLAELLVEVNRIREIAEKVLAPGQHAE